MPRGLVTAISGIAEFRVHELRDTGSRGVNPLQFDRVFELLRAERVANEDVGVGQFLRQSRCSPAGGLHAFAASVGGWRLP